LEGLRELANQGDATAQFALGARYATGEDVKQDYSEALNWFSKAAEQGHVTSQATLGAYYWAGRGVPQDLHKAYFWALLAEAGGDQGSRYRLPVLASRLSKSEIAEAQRQADAWMKKPHDGSMSAKSVSSKNDLSARPQKKPAGKSTTETDVQVPAAEGRQSEDDAFTAPSLSDLGVESNPDKLAGIFSPIPATLPASPGTEAVRISQGSAQALLIKKVQPAYPKQALQARHQGSVQLQATVTKEGKVGNVETLGGDPLLARAAVDAVKQWEYKPYYLNGQPMEVQTQITVNFKLP
jgi:TonB family protein